MDVQNSSTGVGKTFAEAEKILDKEGFEYCTGFNLY